MQFSWSVHRIIGNGEHHAWFKHKCLGEINFKKLQSYFGFWDNSPMAPSEILTGAKSASEAFLNSSYETRVDTSKFTHLIDFWMTTYHREGRIPSRS